MKKIRIFILLVIVLASMRNMAYPLFFKCNSSGHLSDVLLPDELDNYLRGFLATEEHRQKEIAQMLCTGATECLKQFEQIIALTKISQTSAKAELDNVMKRISEKTSSSFKPISKNYFDTQRQIIEMGRVNYLCEQEKKNLTASDFVKNDSLSFFYPNKSNYMYATGCHKVRESDSCTPISKKSVNTLIENAVKMDTDPYAAVAIALMEQGPSSLDSLYLDPIAQMTVMGCKNKFVHDVSNAKENSRVLHSFGNLHKIEEGVLIDPGLSNRLKDYLSTSGKSLQSGKSYFCRHITSAYGSYSTSPRPEYCCLSTDFKGDDDLGHDTENAFVFENVRKVVNTPYEKNDDPAFRLQRFNGFSRLMGGAEDVDVFRSGVNYLETPAYGYQAMDYIINTLLTNPAFSQMVATAEKKFKKKPVNILCAHKSEGYFYIDTNSYFEKHKNAKRMGVLLEKYKNGATYEELTAREKKVFDKEWRSIKKSLDPNYEAERSVQNYLYEINKEEADVLERINLTGLLNLNDKKTKASADRLGKLEKELKEIRQKIKEKYQKFNKSLNIFTDNISYVDEYSLSELFEKNSVAGSKKLEAEKIVAEIKDLESKEQNLIDNQQETVCQLYNTVPVLQELDIIEGKIALYKNENQVISSLRLNTNKPEVKEFLKNYRKLLARQDAFKSELSNPQDKLKEYFDKHYMSRDTIAKASDYTWRPLTIDEIITIGRNRNTDK